MKLIFLSDTHTLHHKLNDLKGDILIHSGDLSFSGKEHEIKNFIEWFKNLEGFKLKIFIAGNHDLSFESKPEWLNKYIDYNELIKYNCVYLEDSSYVYTDPYISRPIKIYGSPYQPEFFHWAFNVPRNSERMEQIWNKIPEDTDILITHGPPHNVLDLVDNIWGAVNTGCEVLSERLKQISPLIHSFGHIHCQRGIEIKDKTLYINASVCDEDYHASYKPIEVEIEEKEGKLEIKEIIT